MTKVILDLDDATPLFMNWDVLFRLKDFFPDFRVSMFWIPFDTKMDYGPYRVRDRLLKKVHENLSWLQLIPHAFRHTNSRELNNVDEAIFKHDLVPKIMEAFNQDGLPYERGFKASHWKWNQGVVNALNDMGWWGAVLSDNYPPMLTPKRFYKFTHLLNEPFWESQEPVLKLHGHTYGTKNDVGLCYDNLMRLPKDTQFEYVTSHIETL